MSDQPTAQEIAHAISDSLPQMIDYSGSDVWEITSRTDLTPIDGGGMAPFAFTIGIKGSSVSFAVIVASTEDLVFPDPRTGKPTFKGNVSFEV